ncbi:Hypothetical Protein CGB_N3140C [Cryptococcus gattii WM276]|uniref:Uncharacterized protein n=1 Tax=Cryptococcus gattii serotype B (strain WM276 / ATCC MYA-4071) TaxID=367775 RepID=E6RFL3_CRYGW|nr:Hypothetical Protein CGB_N3140C [Cryptococcus gattii WM276]ADV25851.1 Hypothetical Protein CGB_N3140C [Cryptococcus gattii WM276]
MPLPGMEQDLSDFIIKLNTSENQTRIRQGTPMTSSGEENIAAELARALQENEALKAEMIRKDKWAEDLARQLEILGGNLEEDKAKVKHSRFMGKGMEANLEAEVTSASSETLSHYKALLTYKLNLPTLPPTKDPLIIQNHLNKLAVQFKGLANGRKYDPILLERHKIHLAAQTLLAPDHIAYAKTAKNQLTFQEWAAGFKEAVLPYGLITMAERNMAALAPLTQNLATIPRFVDKV